MLYLWIDFILELPKEKLISNIIVRRLDVMSLFSNLVLIEDEIHIFLCFAHTLVVVWSLIFVASTHKEHSWSLANRIVNNILF
ncbi:hypothetical protein POPTR_008G062950v4 [Populus trichocarpa]|uniref:Uncharacterized protein n=1 Tax=Populus trichocarpa TaxID=3694 RepID=A0ACC0SK50_POPTR|nr:hypothetical protein POPTR_008G062950v4 [Populus trichocarpa]